MFSGKGKNNCQDDGSVDRECSMTVQFLWWDTIMSSKCLQLQYCLSKSPFNEVDSWLQATNVLSEIKSMCIYWCLYYWPRWGSYFFILNKKFSQDIHNFTEVFTGINHSYLQKNQSLTVIMICISNIVM